MMELTSYGFMGLAAMLVIALCLTYFDEFQPARRKSSFDLINSAHLADSQMIEAGGGNPRFWGQLVQKQETALASLLQTTAAAETGPSAIYSDSFQSDQGRVEALHG